MTVVTIILGRQLDIPHKKGIHLTIYQNICCRTSTKEENLSIL
jgi:hypothetical protein